jgi:flagellar hook-length control protein FliK
LINNLSSVGPSLQDLPSWNSSKPGKAEEDKKESFGRTLETMSSKEGDPARKPVETKTEPKVETRQMSKSEKPERPIQNRQDDDNQDVEEARPQAPNQTPLEKKAALARQKAIAEFMDSFESEFQIPPTRLVQAMAQLPAEELTKNPEETADSVLAQLDLSDEDQDRAKEMYMSLVADLNRIDQSAKNTPKLIAADPGTILNNQTKNRFMEAQEKRVLLNKSLDQMNNKFWIKPEPQALQAQASMQAMNQEMAPETPGLLRDDSFSQNLMANMQDPSMLSPDEMQMPVDGKPLPENPRRGPDIAGQMEHAPKSGNILEELKRMVAEQKMQNQQTAQNSSMPMAAMGMQQASVDADGMETMSPNVPADGLKNMQVKPDGQMMNADISQAVTGMQRQNPQGNFQGEGFSGGGQGFGQQKEASVKPASGKAAKAFGLDVTATPDAMPHPSLQKAGNSSMNSQVTPTAAFVPPTKAESDQNIRQIMNQAQYLIKRGGGEAKVEMSPEGLGRLQMKVMVNDGKVNLQMAAETKEAKQAIENSLSDLKTSLASHKLSVENVKVDVVGATNTHNSAQNSQDNNQQGPRDQGTRQFWEQFQQNFGNSSRQDAMFEMPSVKGYSQKKRDPLQPIEASESAAARKTDNKGNGLNLVA